MRKTLKTRLLFATKTDVNAQNKAKKRNWRTSQSGEKHWEESESEKLTGSRSRSQIVARKLKTSSEFSTCYLSCYQAATFTYYWRRIMVHICAYSKQGVYEAIDAMRGTIEGGRVQRARGGRKRAYIAIYQSTHSAHIHARTWVYVRVHSNTRCVLNI